MSADTLITMAKGGTDERVVRAGSIVVPDLWHLAMRLESLERVAVLETWHLAHDLLKHIQGEPE